MTINLETEVTETGYDPAARVHSYVVERDGKRWTTRIGDVELAQFGPVIGAGAAVNKAKRRQYVAMKIAGRVAGPSDAG